jgi:hypothetical protein
MSDNPFEDGTLWECRPFPKREKDCSSTSPRLELEYQPSAKDAAHDQFGFCESWLTAG